MSAPPPVPHARILGGLVLGAVAGTAVNLAVVEPGPPPRVPEWLRAVNAHVAEPLGQVFLRLLFVTVVPLVFASLAGGVARIGGLGAMGRIAGKTVVYFLVVTVVAAVLGITLVNLVGPGRGLAPEAVAELRQTYGGDAAPKRTAEFTVATFVRQVIPSNPVAAAANLEMLGVITFALLVGVGLTRLPPARAALMQDLLAAIGELMVVIIDLAMRLAPLGVFCLIFVTTSQFGFGLLKLLGGYVGVVLLGLAIQEFVVLPLTVRLLTPVGYREFFRKIRVSLATAFSTSSSNATLPTNLRVARTEFGVPEPIAGFVLPLGATLCMTGTALFEGVTVMFLAQVMLPEPLPLADQVLVVMLCVLTAVGAAGVPGGSIPLVMLVLAAVGVEPGAIALILGIDRLLDMCRTTVNISGDLAAVVIVAHGEGQLGSDSGVAGDRGASTPAVGGGGDGPGPGSTAGGQST